MAKEFDKWKFYKITKMQIFFSASGWIKISSIVQYLNAILVHFYPIQQDNFY